eukprot:1026111_1
MDTMWGRSQIKRIIQPKKENQFKGIAHITDGHNMGKKPKKENQFKGIAHITDGKRNRKSVNWKYNNSTSMDACHNQTERIQSTTKRYIAANCACYGWKKKHKIS